MSADISNCHIFKESWSCSQKDFGLEVVTSGFLERAMDLSVAEMNLWKTSKVLDILFMLNQNQPKSKPVTQEMLETYCL